LTITKTETERGEEGRNRGEGSNEGRKIDKNKRQNRRNISFSTIIEKVVGLSNSALKHRSRAVIYCISKTSVL
jgi:hypothetical protein